MMNKEPDANQQGGPFLQQVHVQMTGVLRQLLAKAQLDAGQLLVIGCSTSEVIGGQIGKSGSEDVAAQIYCAVTEVCQPVGVVPVFQCCEHLNRALVMSHSAVQRLGYDTVSVVPVARAGGAMAAYAYKNLENACVVESVRTHAAIDIGETLIGMHLRPVAVPFRPTIREVGHARVTAAFTRPRLIGGARAVYE